MYSFARTKEYQKSARYFRGAGGTNQGLLALDNPTEVGSNSKCWRFTPFGVKIS